MAKTKAEKAALAEEQRRQQTSVVDLAREKGMSGHWPGGGEPPKQAPKKTK